MRVAVVHEWLEKKAGSEKVVEQFLQIWPNADVFVLVDFMSDDERVFLNGAKVKTSFIQSLPFSKKIFRAYLPFMPIAVEQFDLSGYDLIVSSSHAVAKGVISGPNQFHLSYVHSPIRYAWDFYHQYLADGGLRSGIKSVFARLVLHYLRMWDVRSSFGVDVFVANSQFVSKRIKKFYNRSSFVVCPPVDTNFFTPGGDKENFYVSASRFVPYKKILCIVEAFSLMPDKKIFIIGDGPDFQKAREIATPNVVLLGYQSNDVLRTYLRKARAFIFAAEEDFGISPVEAQACGTPVIAYGKGGVLDSVIVNSKDQSDTGVLFFEQTPQSIVTAVELFEKRADINSISCRANSLKFSPEEFRSRIQDVIAKNTNF